MKKILSRRWRLKGIGLLEIALGLGLFGIFLAGSMRELNYQAQDAKANTASDHLAQAAVASQEYMRTYRTGLLAATQPGGPPIAVPIGRLSAGLPVPPGPPAAPTLPSVQGGGFLSPSYVDRNVYQGHHVLLVRQPMTGTLEALVVARQGQNVPDRALTRIMSRVGAPGGAVLAKPAGPDPGRVQGTGGAWAISSADRALWEQSSPAISLEAFRPVYNLGFSSQAPLQDYLYRNNIGIPEANTMRTALNMGGQNIDAAATVNANQAILQNGGRACAANTTGCMFWISDDGGFVDYNNRWIQFFGAASGFGLYIGGGPGDNLAVQGNTSTAGSLSVGGLTELYSNVNIGGNLNTLGTGRFGNRLGVMADPNDLPPGSVGGVRTLDVIAQYTVAAGYSPTSGQVSSYLSSNGDVGGVRDGLFGRNVRTGGGIATSGYSPDNLPPGWGGGVRTWDVAASGTVGIWDAGLVGGIGDGRLVAGMDRNGWNWGKTVTINNSEAGVVCDWDGSLGRSISTGNPLWCQGNLWRQIMSPVGILRWDGNWTGNNFWCDQGYYIRWYHYEADSSNNAVWAACVKNGY